MQDVPELAASFLKKWGIGLDDLAGYVRPLDNAETLLLVGSIPEGLANPLSDVDLLLIGDGEIGQGMLLAETELQHATSIFQGHEVHVQLLRTADLEQLREKFQQGLNGIGSGAGFHTDEEPTTTQLCLLDRLCNGLALVNPGVAEFWRKRLQLERLPDFLAAYWIREYRALRDDTIYLSQKGDAVSARCTLRLTLSALAAAMLASIGVTNTYPKWRPRLLQRNQDALGQEVCSRLLQYLAAAPAEAPDIERAIAFADDGASGAAQRVSRATLP